MVLAVDPAHANAAEEYHRRGFVVLRSFLDAQTMRQLDIDANQLWADEAERICESNLRCRYMPHHETGQRLFECFDPIIDLSAAMASVARNPRLLAVLGAIYSERAHLFKDKLIFKPAGATGYPLHQDYIAWKSFPKSFVTVLVPLDAASEENGCTVVYEGYHRDGLMTPADGKFYPTPRERVANERRVALEMSPGDIAIFDGFTPHESSPNRSDSARRQLYLSYNAHRDGGEQRDAHYAEFHRWLKEKYAGPMERPWYFA
jgi:2-aminoethylphosphonate dioxygenase